MRPARESDRRILLEWRNDPDTRSASTSHEPVTDEEHTAWFSHALSDPDVLVYIGELGDEPVGTVRFDRSPGRVEVSINLGPDHRGRGLSRPLLTEAIEIARVRLGDDLPILARIRDENAVSRQLFESAGFVPAGTDENGLGLFERAAAMPADPS